MKKQVYFIILFLVGGFTSKAQYMLKNVEDVKWYNNIAQEKIYVHYNSNLLLAGEELLYKVYCKNAKTDQFTTNSKIAYVELVGEEGVVFKHKIRLESGVGQGHFFIPSTLASKNYKLLAYTRWMRNGDGNHFFSADINIINPYTRINFDDSAPLINIKANKNKKNSNQINLTINKDSLNTRQEVVLTIESLNASKAFGKYSISVKKNDKFLSTIKPDNSLTFTRLFTDSKVSRKRNIGEKVFLPEFEGEMITGKVIEKTSKLPVPNAEVALSILSNEACQDMVLTNSNGVFFFHVKSDYSSSKAMIQALGDNKQNYIVEVFNHQKVNKEMLKFTEFKIHPTFKPAILQRSIYNQIQNAYQNQGVKKNKIITPIYPKPLYGNYMKTYVLDDYKRFPTIAETLIEVVEKAWHERRNGKTRYVEIRGRENDPYFGVNLLPMLIVDGALEENHQRFLGFNAKNVKTISVLRDEYYYGDRVYQGALLVKTFNDNYTNDLEGSFIKKFNLFNPELKTAYFNQLYHNKEDSKRIPDYRTQLLWLPYFYLKKQKDKIRFFTSDNKGTYEISLEGFTNEGVPISITKNFTVN
ncbi:hypothetical protein OD91_1618 [Lutibacter sp. Hel_I_33_5]|uniref:hypothetical protein n=1 Tax=Lutibacter sp. Hel_I_33_5 TaxID=1566289 RepID=UPI0011A8449D|nr:hypothetical protein [Lutibacter sp. Hel_I_33_5]TVZ56333.1 hypothetical protein OD91_1618 [Lutibacter sp. Hel_I_33_5]